MLIAEQSWVIGRVTVHPSFGPCADHTVTIANTGTIAPMSRGDDEVSL